MEEAAIRSKSPAHAVLYDLLTHLHEDAKKAPRNSPPALEDLNRRYAGIVQAYASIPAEADGGRGAKVANFLEAAQPNVFTFLSNPGMPSHNNDTERDIRDMIIPQRNIRHQLKTAEGYNVFSTVMTISGTCKKQNIAVERAVIELITDPDWNIFGTAEKESAEGRQKSGRRRRHAEESLVNPDGSQFTLLTPDGKGLRNDPVDDWKKACASQ